jgi:hypothetical protein
VSQRELERQRRVPRAIGLASVARSARRAPVLWLLGALTVLLVTSAAALAAAPRANRSYAATGPLKTVISLHTSLHRHIPTFSFGGDCGAGKGTWFFNSHGERAIPVTASGKFSLRRTESDVMPPSSGTGAPLTGTFTFTLSGSFGSGGRTVSGKLSFVSSSPLGVNCRTGSVAFHGRLQSGVRAH